ncbi:MAG: hypothetical protein V3R67_03505 [Thermodesulfobacteriota bacterium]
MAVKIVKKDKKPVEKNEVEQAFWIDLTPDEMKKLGREAAAQNSRLERDKEEYKDIQKEWRGKLKNEQLTLSETLNNLDRGQIYKEVKCTQVKDFNKGTVEWKHGDKVIHSRDMDPDELDGNVGVFDGGATNKPNPKTGEVNNVEPAGAAVC